MGSSESVIHSERRVDYWLLFAVIAALLVIYFSTVVSFYNVYSDEGSGQTHTPLLLLVILYLLYRNWSLGGRSISLHFNYWALVLLTPLSLLWMALGLVFVEAGQQVMLILIVATVVIAMLGVRIGKRYLMPILLLLTVLPIWNLLIPYLQLPATQFSAFLLDLIGFTSTREGFLLIIPNGTFEVADACSGLKFQIVGITLALIHTQLIKVPARVVLSYAVVAACLAFVSNALRIVIVVAIGYRYGMDHEYVQDHNFIGWTLFSIFFFLFLYFGEKKLRSHEIKPAASETKHPRVGSAARQVMQLVMVVLAVSVGPILYGYFTHRGQAATQDNISVLKELSGWQMISDQLTDWTPVWTQGDRSLEGTFTHDGERVDLFATEFYRQRHGREAVQIGHMVYHIDKWSRISRSARVVKVSDAFDVTVEETLLKSSDQRKRIVWQWYRTNNKFMTSKVEAKLNNLLGVIVGEPDITVFVLSKEITRNQAHAADVLKQFLRAYLARTGGIS